MVLFRPGGIIGGGASTVLCGIFQVMVDDSEFYDYAVKFEKLFWGEGTLFVFIVDSPDFADRKSIDQFMNFVSDLENLEYAVGSDSTQLWVKGFLDYVESWRFRTEEYNRELANYLDGQVRAKMIVFCFSFKGKCQNQRFINFLYVRMKF